VIPERRVEFEGAAMKRLGMPKSAATLLLIGMLSSTGLLAAPALAQAPTAAVLSYHGDATRSGRFVVPGLTWAAACTLHPDRDFHAQFQGHVYAQPLFWQPPGSGPARLIVATEDDTVLALDASTGRTIWERSLGKPVALGALPCGNIDPLGITGTPVIDPKTGTLYLDAMVASASGPRHRVFALALRDGAILHGWPVDVADAVASIGMKFNPVVQNERGALALLDGRVYVPFGGHFGDCSTYHGWIVGLSIAKPGNAVAWATRAAAGGIWAPGGIASDGKALFVATGNTMGTERWRDGEAIIRLAPNLRHNDRPKDFFTPSDWRALDERDADLGGSNPMLFDIDTPSGLAPRVLALGKDSRAYLLNRDDLGGIGGNLAAKTVARGPIRTSPAVFQSAGGALVAFEGEGIDCPSNRGDLTVLRITAGTPPSIDTAWCGAMQGHGAPIVTTTDGRSDPVVWILGAEGDNRLHGYRGDTGAPIYVSPQLAGLHHFQTLIAAGGHIYVGADGRAYAFAF
jgi:hypothetical protein